MRLTPDHRDCNPALRIGRNRGLGNDGVVGISLFMGGDSTPSRALILSGGGAYRLRAQSEGALKLQTAGLLDYTRGRIRVLDREGLEKRTCECYAVVKKEYARLLPDRLAA